MLTSSLQIYTSSRSGRGAAWHTLNPVGLCKASLCRMWYVLNAYLAVSWGGGTGTHLCPTLSRHRPQAGEVESRARPQQQDKIKGNLSCTTCFSTPVLLPSPLTWQGGGGRVDLGAQLCFESILMDLVYWLRLNHFLGAPDGQPSREHEASAFSPQGTAHTPLSPSLPWDLP